MAVSQRVFEINYLAQSLHPADHEPQYERIDTGEPGEAKTEGRMCKECGFMQAKEITWAPRGGSGLTNWMRLNYQVMLSRPEELRPKNA